MTHPTAAMVIAQFRSLFESPVLDPGLRVAHVLSAEPACSTSGSPAQGSLIIPRPPVRANYKRGFTEIVHPRS